MVQLEGLMKLLKVTNTDGLVLFSTVLRHTLRGKGSSLLYTSACLSRSNKPRFFLLLFPP